MPSLSRHHLKTWHGERYEMKVYGFEITSDVEGNSLFISQEGYCGEEDIIQLHISQVDSFIEMLSKEKSDLAMNIHTFKICTE